MTEEAAIAYMYQQMRLLGKSTNQYHWERVYVLPTTDEAHGGYFEIKAFNELYILYNEQNYYGLFILGENSTFNSEDMRLTGPSEFTGTIRFFKQGGAWNLEIINADGTLGKPIPIQFLRVVY